MIPLHICDRTAYTLTCPLCSFQATLTLRGVWVVHAGVGPHTGGLPWSLRRLTWMKECEVRG